MAAWTVLASVGFLGAVAGAEHAPVDALEAVLRDEMGSSFDNGEISAVARAIRFECARHHIEPALVLGMMRIESGFRRHRRSPVGALGLMQLLPATAEEVARRNGVAWWGPRTLFDPVRNVRLGVSYLAWLRGRLLSPDYVLAAYCHGPGTVKARPTPHVFNYAKKVKGARRTMRWRLRAWKREQV